MVSVMQRYLVSLALLAHIAFSVFLLDMPDKQRSVSAILGIVRGTQIVLLSWEGNTSQLLVGYSSVLHILHYSKPSL